MSNATVYGLCERGELPYVWVVTSMRIRPRELEEFVATRLAIPEKSRPHEDTAGRMASVRGAPFGENQFGKRTTESCDIEVPVAGVEGRVGEARADTGG